MSTLSQKIASPQIITQSSLPISIRSCPIFFDPVLRIPFGGNHDLLMMLAPLLLEPQTTVDTRHRLASTVSNFDVLQRMPQRSSPPITHGHVTFHLDGRYFLDEFKGIRAVFAQFILAPRPGQNIEGFILLV
mmetsp:Transcript_10603/g.20639  ORF Transcript_10603/g.20639 Transcript_10603/m.20639 type:complete len:132 (-) Transcript_10603:189-584(-)